MILFSQYISISISIYLSIYLSIYIAHEIEIISFNKFEFSYIDEQASSNLFDEGTLLAQNDSGDGGLILVFLSFLAFIFWHRSKGKATICIFSRILPIANDLPSSHHAL